LNLLHLLGTGDGSADAERSHSAYLYRFPQSAVQIDAGEPASRAFKGLGLPYDTVDRIILSHLHFDHIGGFFMLMQGYWLERRRKHLVVHLPADGIEAVRTMLRTSYLFDDVLPFRLCFEPLSAQHSIRLPYATITPFFTTHLEGTRKQHQVKFPARYEAFCFLIETTSGLRIVHSADLGAPKDLAALLDAPTDLLVCELAHFEPAQLFAFLQGKPIKRLLLTHLLHEYYDQREEVANLAREMLPGVTIEIAHDGGCLKLD
jgi:ribonuclease BN (tRNA processing enzyme)